MEKELANWIFYECGVYYCSTCVEKRVNEINTKKEFEKDIAFDNGDRCGYMQGYAEDDYEVSCCKCDQKLYSGIDP